MAGVVARTDASVEARRDQLDRRSDRRHRSFVGLAIGMVLGVAVVNDVADPGAEISRLDLAYLLGGNWARFARLDGWSERETVEQLEEREQGWRRT